MPRCKAPQPAGLVGTDTYDALEKLPALARKEGFVSQIKGLTDNTLIENSMSFTPAHGRPMVSNQQARPFSEAAQATLPAKVFAQEKPVAATAKSLRKALPNMYVLCQPARTMFAVICKRVRLLLSGRGG